MGAMEVDRGDGRTSNQLRPLACSRNVLHRAHGSARWSQGDTIVLAAVFGPKSGAKKGENPEKASIEVIWKPKTGQIGKVEKEYEMILKRTLQSISLLTIHPNTTTSVIVQVVGDDGAVSFTDGFLVLFFFLQFFLWIRNKNTFLAGYYLVAGPWITDQDMLLPCAINASCAALLDAGIPLKYLAVAICCGLTENRSIILDPTKIEEKKIQAFAYLVFPNSPMSVLHKDSLKEDAEPIERGIITSVTHGTMPVVDYFNCLERGYAACAKISEFLRKSMESQTPSDLTKPT